MKLLKILSKLLPVFFVLSFVVSKTMAQQIDRVLFYKAMASKSVEEVDQQIAAVKQNASAEKEAFEGALLMKKADLVKPKKEKLKLFKEGREKLEKMINKQSKNAEYRFLRLQIQENAPKILGYKKELDDDKKLIISLYNSLSPELKQYILDYSKQSEILMQADL